MSTLVTEKDIETMEAVLEEKGIAALARMSNKLNHWKWPGQLENPEPPELSGNTSRRRQLMEWIEERIGNRAVLREHNSDMSELEFNDFWRGTFEHHGPSRDRHRARMMAEAEKEIAKEKSSA